METATPDRFLTLEQVRDLHPVSRATRWRMVRDGDFPPPVRISPGRIAWRESDVRQWIAARR